MGWGKRLEISAGAAGCPVSSPSFISNRACGPHID